MGIDNFEDKPISNVFLLPCDSDWLKKASKSFLVKKNGKFKIIEIQ